METILQDIPHVAVYLDDIILTGATKAQLLETMDIVLGRLDYGSRERNAHFSKTRLCNRIDQRGLHPVHKVEAILKARSLENVRELQATTANLPKIEGTPSVSGSVGAL